MKVKILIFNLMLSFIFTGCSDVFNFWGKVEEKPDEKIILYYNNGFKFCEGIHRVYKKRFSTKKNRKGIWNFYNPDGTVAQVIKYDKNGNTIFHYSYNDEGQLEKTLTHSSKTDIYLEFYSDGAIKFENIRTLITKKDEDDEEYVIKKELVSRYHKNGKLRSQKEYVDDEIQGKYKCWDEKGNLLIEVEFVDGLIKKKYLKQ